MEFPYSHIMWHTRTHTPKWFPNLWFTRQMRIELWKINRKKTQTKIKCQIMFSWSNRKILQNFTKLLVEISLIELIFISWFNLEHCTVNNMIKILRSLDKILKWNDIISEVTNAMRTIRFEQLRYN